MKNGKSIACKVGLGIWFEIKLKASDEDKLFRDKSSKVWDDWCRMESACDEGGWRMKITGLQTCSGQIKNWNDWFADWVWPILITGLQTCSGLWSLVYRFVLARLRMEMIGLQIESDQFWSLVCRFVLARLRIEIIGLQIEFDQICIDWMVDIWNGQQSVIFGWGIKIAYRGTCIICRLRLTGLQNCPG